MSDTHFYEPSASHRLKHNPFKAIVAPRPIGWISTVDKDGRRNIAPYSFFNAISEDPPILMFSGDDHKDSIANAEATGEFVFNLVTLPFVKQMNDSSATVGHEVDEFRLSGLKSAPSRNVKAPRVAGIAAAIECKTLHIHRIKTLSGRMTGRSVVMGEAVGIHLDPQYIKDGLFDTAAAQPVARCGYRGDYAVVTEVFELVRPNEAQTRELLERQSELV